MKITLLIPTLNEIQGMKAVMPRVKPEWVDQILIVDGGSTDGTPEYSKERGYDVMIQKKKGLRFAFIEALPVIKGEAIIAFSPDGNSIPELIPQLSAKMREGYDMVIASRYLDGAKSEDDDFITAFGNWLMTKTVNILHGGHYTDSVVMLRAYRKQMVYDLELEREEGYRLFENIFMTRLGWEPLMSVRAAKRHLKVTEIPGDEPPRIGGRRKLQIIRWGLAYFSQFIWEVFFWR